MCVIAFAWDHSPQFKLALIGNRDEFYARPSAAAAQWEDRPGILGGRDLQEGGTWLAASPGRGAAAVTNVRGGVLDARPLSRGALPVSFLDDPAAFHTGHSDSFDSYRAFNFVGFTPDRACYLSNAQGEVQQELGPGLHHVSNGALDAKWPKSLLLRDTLSAWLADGQFDDFEPLFATMRRDDAAPDAELPDTGIGIERERLLAPPFIVTPDYGTRTSSVLLLDHEFRGLLVERHYRSGERQGPDNRLAIG
jgi:uncharacterized protein with NRDE domain